MKSERKQTCTLDKFATPLPEVLKEKKMLSKKVRFLAPAWLFACKSQCVHLGVESCKTLNVYHSVYLLLLVYVQHSLPPVVHMQLHPPVTPEGPTPGVTPGGTLGGYPGGSCGGHFSCNPPLQAPRTLQPPSHQVAISLFRPPGKSWNS